MVTFWELGPSWIKLTCGACLSPFLFPLRNFFGLAMIAGPRTSICVCVFAYNLVDSGLICRWSSTEENVIQNIGAWLEPESAPEGQ